MDGPPVGSTDFSCWCKINGGSATFLLHFCFISCYVHLFRSTDSSTTVATVVCFQLCHWVVVFFSKKIDLKDMYLPYTKEFSWKKKWPKFARFPVLFIYLFILIFINFIFKI
jgi:hypothetical protein